MPSKAGDGRIASLPVNTEDLVGVGNRWEGQRQSAPVQGLRDHTLKLMSRALWKGLLNCWRGGTFPAPCRDAAERLVSRFELQAAVCARSGCS